MARSTKSYRKHFSAKTFWKKIQRVARKVGLDAIYSMLVLYYTAQAPKTPGWAKTKIYGALGYFIFPVDSVPDWWPYGYVDDIAVIALALGAVAMHITPDIKNQAREKLRDWFGEAASETNLVS